MDMNGDQTTALREQLLHAMRGDESHIEFDSAIGGFSGERAGTKPAGAPHSAWQLMEHLRIAQRDILEFSRDPNHKSPKWPEEYWPEGAAPPNKDSWEQSVAAFKNDAKAMEELVTDPQQDLFEPIEGGQGQTLLREAMVLAAHNSYHLGQLVFLIRSLS